MSTPTEQGSPSLRRAGALLGSPEVRTGLVCSQVKALSHGAGVAIYVLCHPSVHTGVYRSAAIASRNRAEVPIVVS